MAEPKTRPTGASVDDFISAVDDPQKREDCRTVAAMMERIVGAPPRMWGPSIVGFGHYRLAGTAGNPAIWPITGFSPRKANLTLYIGSGFSGHDALLARLGKHTTGKSCLYIKRLTEIDMAVLEELVAQSVAYFRATYETEP